MDTNFQPTPDQPESTQPMPLVQKSNHGLLMAVCALLLFSLMANAYFFVKMNGNNQVDQPDGPQIPVVQTETEPTANISETPGSETPVSLDSEEMMDWKTLKTNYFKVQYSPDIKLTNIGSSTYALEKWGPTQREGTEVSDGIAIQFKIVEITETSVEQYAKNRAEESDAQFGEVIQEVRPIMFGSNKGFTYTALGQGLNRYYFFSVSKIGSNMILEIIDNTVDPTNQGYTSTVQKILDTLEIY